MHSCGSPIAFHMIVLWYFLWFACDAEEDDATAMTVMMMSDDADNVDYDNDEDDEDDHEFRVWCCVFSCVSLFDFDDDECPW